MKFLVFALAVLIPATAYCGGRSSMKLVNEKEIGVDNAQSIEVLYQFQEVTLLKSPSNSLILKEYMSEDISDYYADVTNAGNKLTIKGNHPVLGLGTFRARVEVYVPAHFTQDISITTSSGRIALSDDYTFSRIVLKSSSGSISVNTLKAEAADISTSSGRISVDTLTAEAADISTSSGRISLDRITGALTAKSSSGRISGETVNGNVSAENTSGGISFDMVAGSIEAKTSSGKIDCSVNEITGDIMLSSTSGRVELTIPRNANFNFSARRTSGGLSTPFSDRLFSPVSDKRLVQGIIGDGTPKNSIDIRTTSGSINVKWNQ